MIEEGAIFSAGTGLAMYFTVDSLAWAISTFVLMAGLVSLVRGGLREAQAVPPSARRSNSLTFEEIADYWSDELKNEPAPWNKQQIMHDLIRGLWNGDFEDGVIRTQLVIDRTSGDGVDRKYYDEAGNRVVEPEKIPFNRLVLVAVMPGIEGVNLPEKREILEAIEGSDLDKELIIDKIPWESLKAIRPSEYDPVFLSAYLSKLRIIKRDFRRWVIKNGYTVPRFWFG